MFSKERRWKCLWIGAGMVMIKRLRDGETERLRDEDIWRFDDLLCIHLLTADPAGATIEQLNN